MPIDFSARIEALSTQADGGEAPAQEAPAEAAPNTPNTPNEAPATPATPEQSEAERVLAAKRALIEEKLHAQREKRKAAGLSSQARADREAAAQARAAAEAERGRYESLKQGTFKQTIEALGRDPRAVFEEMQREAIEASTPEAELRKLRADFERQMGEQLRPLQETIDALKAERQQLAAREYEMSLAAAFQSTVTDAKYLDLRAEYGDEGLHAYVKKFDRDPAMFIAAAKQYAVPLTDPSQGFTMQEILDVLKAAQDAHDRGKQERRQKLMPASAPGQTQPGKPPTVNGTAARSNAGTPIGNDLASERAAPTRKMSRAERIQAEIDRVEKR
jgi:hypothetical protein